MLAFVVEKDENNQFTSSVKEIEKPICEDNEIIIKTEYSSINYKDALSSIGNKGVSKNFPHITGIDVAGVVFETKSNLFKIGDNVLVTGYDLGMNTNGGHSQFVKVPASWVIKVPNSLTTKEVMSYGTAGLTAALSINELLNNNINSEDCGEILVTGSTGGVGSLAVSILNKLGFKVVALTSKNSCSDYLKNIGASRVLFKEDFLKDKNKPILKEQFSAVVDTVGGDILSTALKQTEYNGVVTCCGLTASYELNTNVFPFILRGIKLIGIDSVECSLDKKQSAWDKLAGKFRIKGIENIVYEIDLYEIAQTYQKLLDGKAIGRYIVKIN